MGANRKKIVRGEKAKQVFLGAIKYYGENLKFPKLEYLGGIFKEGYLYIGFCGEEFFSEEFSCKEEAIKYAKGEPCKDLYRQQF